MITGFSASRTAAIMFAILAAAAVFAPGPSARAETRVTVGIFYDELAPHGHWVHHPRYGSVWYPYHQPANWAPYVYGRWVWTADYGWYWDSEEDWAWATYHYGRWVYTDAYGWVWVPDDEWGPAWVEWRTGGGYVGWAPMPPEVTWRADAFVYADADMSASRYRPHWIFVAEASFTEPDPWRYRAPPKRNRALLSATVRATDYRVVDARIVNRSIDVRRISAAAKVRIKPATMMKADSSAQARAHARTHGRIAVYRPRMLRANVRVPAPPVRARAETDIDSDLPPEIESRATGSIDTRGSIGAGAGIGIGGGGIGIGGGGGIGIGK